MAGWCFWVVSARQRSVLPKPLAWPFWLWCNPKVTLPTKRSVGCHEMQLTRGRAWMWPPPVYVSGGAQAPFSETRRRSVARLGACCCMLPGSSAPGGLQLGTCGGNMVAMVALPQSEYTAEPPPSAESPSEIHCPVFCLFLSLVVPRRASSSQMRPLRKCANEPPLKKNKSCFSGLPHVRSAYAEHTA